MMKSERIKTLLALALAAVLCLALGATMAEDEKAIAGLTEQLETAKARLESASLRHAEQKAGVEGDLAEVKRLKQNAKRSFLEERKLENLLKRSRDGIRELERLGGEKKALEREALKYAAALMVMYNRLIDEALRSRAFARQEGASQLLAGWIIARQRHRQLYFDLREAGKDAKREAPRLLALETARGEKVQLAREILDVQIELIDRELLLLEERLEDYRTERSHWLRMRRFMHEMSRRRGDPVMDDVLPEERAAAGEVLSPGRDIEKVEVEIKRLEAERRELREERKRAYKLKESLGEEK